MGNFLAGMKIYSLDWYWKYGWSYEEAAAQLKDMGINFIIATQNRYLPLDDSVMNVEVTDEKKARMESFDDVEAREVFRKAGIGYYGAFNIFFNPVLMKKHGNYPCDAQENRAEQIDWYIGACPTCEAYVDEVIDTLKLAMSELDLDGVFIGFMRFPGFWELILPDTDMGEWKEYCFCPRCIEQFEKASGIKVQPSGGQSKGEWILQNARVEWTAFKCRVIADVVAKIKKAICAVKPDAKLILNTLPFTYDEGKDYARNLFGQDPELLKNDVDIFEVMCYHQILVQPVEWIGETGKYIKEKTGKTVVCTVQNKAWYTEGLHAGRGRSLEITADEFAQEIEDVKQAKLDGIVVFTLSDFLETKYEDGDDTLMQVLKRELSKV